MSVLVFADTANGKIVKSAFEAVSYGAKIASDKGVEMNVVTYGDAGDDELNKLGNFGAGKIMVDRGITRPDASQLAGLITSAAKNTSAEIVVVSNDFTGKAVSGLLGAMLDAGVVSNVVDYPETDNGFIVKSQVFSSKAFARMKVLKDVKVLMLLPNAIGAHEMPGNPAIEAFESGASAKVTVTDIVMDETDGKVPLPEAELVVSAGRGMKGPENWGIIEELADALGASTACSRPVSDLGWRPHHEHVGQTGLAIRPNLYIAIGISGAIQHLAGVNGSKVIVVINNDPEAPFFKAADYGIVGDLFEVVPKLTEAVKKLKAG